MSSKCFNTPDQNISQGAKCFSTLKLCTTLVHARSSIACDSASAVDTKQFFKGMFNALLNEEYSTSIDIDRYQGVLDHTLLEMDFSQGAGNLNSFR